MHVFLSDIMNGVIFAEPLNLSQSSEEGKVVPKTKDMGKIKGSSKSRVIIQDNRSAPPPLPDLPTGMHPCYPSTPTLGFCSLPSFTQNACIFFLAAEAIAKRKADEATTEYLHEKAKKLKYDNSCESRYRAELINRIDIQCKQLELMDIQKRVELLKEEK